MSEYALRVVVDSKASTERFDILLRRIDVFKGEVRSDDQALRPDEDHAAFHGSLERVVVRPLLEVRT